MDRPKKYRRFSDEFKREAVRLVRDSRAPRDQIAREIGVSASTLASWIKIAARPSEPLLEDERRELLRLRRDLRRVEQERDILKKAMAFFARENQ
jgi:transposase